MRNAANVETNGSFPRVLNPTPTPTMFCSAIKHSKNRSGNTFINVSENVEFFVSPSSATTLGSTRPNRASALP